MTAGQAVRETRIIRATGLPAQVIDTKHPESPVGPPEDPGASPGRFATYCPTHRGFRTYPTWKAARANLAAPEDWCTGCAELLEKAGPKRERNGGFSPEERERALEARRRRAAERRSVRDAAKEERRAERDAEGAWAAFVREAPWLDTEDAWTAEDRQIVHWLRIIQIDAQEAQTKARREIRAVEAELNPAPKDPLPKPKRRKELERRQSALEAAEQTAAEQVRFLRGQRDHLARVTYLRACREAGWRIHRNGTGTELRRRGRDPVRLPPGYLPEEALS